MDATEGMATFRYPANDFDQSAKLLSLLGSFWENTYEDGLVEDLMVTYALGAKQTHAEMLELIAAVGRSTVPVYHVQQWYQLVLKASERNTDESIVLQRYGGGHVYGIQPGTGIQYKYGESWYPSSVFPIPTDLAKCPLIFNRLTSPSVSLIAGLDYIIDRDHNAIILRDNPFDNELVAKRVIYEDGEATDTEASLWLFRAQFDQEDIYTQFGYPLRFELASTDTYRNAVNAIWDGLVCGTAKQDIEAMVAAVCDVPLVQGTETVEDIVEDANHLVVITDANVYEFNPNAVALVAVGATVHAGDQLTNAVRFYEFNRGQIASDLLAVAIGKEFLSPGYYDAISFYNREVAVQVDTSGIFTKVSFELGGWPGDVEAFWTEFHERGVAAGTTLAHLLDERTNKVGEPGASNLPTTINPLEFLAENVLRNNVFVVKIGLTRLGLNAASLQHLRQVRRLMVPHTAMLLLVELDVDEDTARLNEMAEDDVDPYLGSEPYTETCSVPSYTSEEVAIQYIGGHCI